MGVCSPSPAALVNANHLFCQQLSFGRNSAQCEFPGRIIGKVRIVSLVAFGSKIGFVRRQREAKRVSAECPTG
jgi:hypothetical protein